MICPCDGIVSCRPFKPRFLEHLEVVAFRDSVCCADPHYQEGILGFFVSYEFVNPERRRFGHVLLNAERCVQYKLRNWFAVGRKQNALPLPSCGPAGGQYDNAGDNGHKVSNRPTQPKRIADMPKRIDHRKAGGYDENQAGDAKEICFPVASPLHLPLVVFYRDWREWLDTEIPQGPSQLGDQSGAMKSVPQERVSRFLGVFRELEPKPVHLVRGRRWSLVRRLNNASFKNTTGTH